MDEFHHTRGIILDRDCISVEKVGHPNHHSVCPRAIIPRSIFKRTPTGVRQKTIQNGVIRSHGVAKKTELDLWQKILWPISVKWKLSLRKPDPQELHFYQSRNRRNVCQFPTSAHWRWKKTSATCAAVASLDKVVSRVTTHLVNNVSECFPRREVLFRYAYNVHVITLRRLFCEPTIDLRGSGDSFKQSRIYAGQYSSNYLISLDSPLKTNNDNYCPKCRL